ncbi:MAG TPA: SDR family NAD(P)-dependent oxidoreductase, partial [Acidimicrobiales bacterium]
MRVMVTGGTGFVGAHTVKALVDAGHSVRLLVRTPAKIDEVLKPLGVNAPDYVVGDMTDEASVEAAMEGCDGALHAAAVVALDQRRAAAVLEANPRGAEVVLGAAVRRGLDPIVHVSSVSALFAPGVEVIHADLPPTRWGSGYGRSKAKAEEVARRLQEAGAPVVITYPGAVLGPPAGAVIGESTEGVVLQLQP